MDDMISRQAAIDALNLADDRGQIHSILDAVDVIKALPSAQQWVPWYSGELPKESGQYIVTAYDGNVSRVTFAKYQKRLKRWELTGARAYWRVLTWCPLPEPWKGRQDE